jgi:AAHS family 4-hydroxybenzoate transporter-like MFS transporter
MFRFLAGIGIGGVVPNTIALLTETAPKRFRVSAVMAGFVGYSLGNATIGQVAAWFIPTFGWSIVFLVAGAAGTILSVVLLLALPESIPSAARNRTRRVCARWSHARGTRARAPPESRFGSAAPGK